MATQAALAIGHLHLLFSQATGQQDDGSAEGK
jgi:hypothetical protein